MTLPDDAVTSPVSSAQLRRAMARLPTGVVVVTSLDGHEPVGMTVSAFTSVSDDPPTVLVCLNRKSRAADVVRESGRYCVNLLSGSHGYIAQTFATSGLDHADRFARVRSTTARTGAPVLADALSWLDCSVREVLEVGTHIVAIGTVVAAGQGDADETPLAYYNRNLGPFA